MMLPNCFWLLILAILASAQQPWEINRSPTARLRNPNGIPDTRHATYYLDASCARTGRDLRPVMAEVQRMAMEGFNRLRGNLDDFKTGYNKIMKVRPEDDIVLRDQVVLRVFYRIWGMVPEGSREAADIRIYCDNDESQKSIEIRGGVDPANPFPRWIRAPDGMHPDGPRGDGIPNSQLPFQLQRWLDPLNLMYRAEGSMGVQDIDPATRSLLTLGQTYRGRVGEPLGHNRERETITIADIAFGPRTVLAQFFGTQIVSTDFPTFQYLTSVTLFHELCHSHHISGVAAPADREITGWHNILNAPPHVVRESADAYAFLGLYALMNSRNIRFHTTSDNLIPLHQFVDPLKAKRSHIHNTDRFKNSALSPNTYTMMQTQAVPFIS